MFAEVKLLETQKKYILKFKWKISWWPEACKMGNEEVTYLIYFLDSLLEDNFAWAANTGIIFIEKYLRTKLLFIKSRESENQKEWRLEYLDSEESALEDGIAWADNFERLKKEYIACMNKYKIDGSISREVIMQKLNDYLDYIDQEWTPPRRQASFSNICDQLKKRWKLSKERAKELKSFFAKYRNPLLHGSFKRLINQATSGEKTVVVSAWTSAWIQSHSIDISNALLREVGNSISILLHNISIDTFNLISNLLENDFNEFKE